MAMPLAGQRHCFTMKLNRISHNFKSCWESHLHYTKQKYFQLVWQLARLVWQQYHVIFQETQKGKSYLQFSLWVFATSLIMQLLREVSTVNLPLPLHLIQKTHIIFRTWTGSLAWQMEWLTFCRRFHQQGPLTGETYYSGGERPFEEPLVQFWQHRKITCAGSRPCSLY